MSFLTRKPENAPVSGADSVSGAGSAASTLNADSADAASVPGAGSSFLSGKVSGGAEGVSLAGLYQALADSQKQLADYLLAREAECRSGLLSAGASGAAAVSSVSDRSGAVLGEGQLLPLLERINMLGQFMDQQMMPAISQRFDLLEMLLKNCSAGLMASASEASVAAPAVEAVPGAGPASASAGMEAANSYAAAAGMDSTSNAPVSESVPVSASPSASVSAPASRSSRGASDIAQLEKAFFGEMALEPSIRNERSCILQGILAHDAVSSYLGGILMMFQASAPDKMVLLLKDLGEAFYRWANSMPETNLEQFEDVLARWAQWLCESAGLQNRIELAMTGQRFDATRHNSTTRGVTVTCVHGWVVLRGNGSVYSKALVDVQ